MTKSFQLLLHSCHHIFKCNINFSIFFYFTQDFFICPLLTLALRTSYLNNAIHYIIILENVHKRRHGQDRTYMIFAQFDFQ
jgi:hypothetical protein